MLLGGCARILCGLSRAVVGSLRPAQLTCQRSFGIGNVTPINTPGGLELPLDTGTIDHVLPFDVLLPFYFGDAALVRVVKELHRVSKPAGRLAVYPSHVSIDDVRPAITGAGFTPVERLILPILHNGTIPRDGIVTLAAGGDQQRGR